MRTEAVSVRQLRNETPRVIELIEAGVQVTLTSRGVPIAEIHPVESARSTNPARRFIDEIAVLRGEPYDSGLADRVAADRADALAAQARDRWV